MTPIVTFLRGCAKLKFKILGHATIKDIPTDQFIEIVESLTSSGWQRTYVYNGFGAWIDYTNQTR